MTRPKNLAAALLVVAVGLFILSQATGFAGDKDLLSNGGFTDDLSSWETTISPGYENNAEIVHDRQYFGFSEGSLKVETGRGRGIRVEAVARQQIKGLKTGSKLRLSLWWRKLVIADGKDAQEEISVWLIGKGVAPLLLWSDKTVPPLPGTAVSSRINGLETARSVAKSGAYELVVRFTMKNGADLNSQALAQVDDLSLEVIEEAPIVIRQTALPSQTVKAGARGVKALAFSLQSATDRDMVSSITLKEGDANVRSFTRIRLFQDVEPIGRLGQEDSELAETVNENGVFAFEALVLPLSNKALHLLAAVDMAENAPDGQSQSLVLEQVKRLYRRTSMARRSSAPITVDAKPPASAGSFLIMSEAMPFLIWENPSDPDFVRFRLVKKKNAPPTGPFDPRAKVLVDTKRPAGPIGTFVDRRAGEGKFFYAVYTADRLGNHYASTRLGVNAGSVELSRAKALF